MHKHLPGGLILRSLSEGHATDTERLPAFYADIFAGDHALEHTWFIAWVNDLMSGHPTVTGDDIWVVVDPAHAEQIVSAVLLIPHVWRYEDVEVPFGRPELVATHPDYRRRGLVRELMTVAHERSAALGHLMQGITGIVHYYRQFGYAMTLELGMSSTVALSHIPALPEGQTPQFTLRPATSDDISQMVSWEAYAAHAFGITSRRDADLWRYELYGRNPNSHLRLDCRIIANAAGEGVGYVMLRKRLDHRTVHVHAYVVGDQTSYAETYEDVMRGVQAYGRDSDPVPDVIAFESGMHPTVKVLIERTFTGHLFARPHAWYIRVPDVAAFLRHIAPVLERRLEGSGAHRYTGEVSVSFFDRTGVRLRFERGRLAEAENLTGLYEQDADAGYPWHMFLNMVTGYQNYEQMRAIIPDIYCNAKAHVLLGALFPLRLSSVYALA